MLPQYSIKHTRKLPTDLSVRYRQQKAQQLTDIRDSKHNDQ